MFRAVVVGVQKHKDDVGPAKRGDLDIMFDSKSKTSVVSNLDCSFSRGANWSCNIELEMLVVIPVFQPTADKNGNGIDLAVSFDDGHDDRVVFHGQSDRKKSASVPVVQGSASVQSAFDRRSWPTFIGGFIAARTSVLRR